MLTKRGFIALILCLMLGALALLMLPTLARALQPNAPGPQGDPLTSPIPQLDEIGAQ